MTSPLHESQTNHKADVPPNARNGPSDRAVYQRKPNYNQIHSRPLPIKVHPLPSFIPHNPISIMHMIWSFLSEAWFHPSSHPQPRHKGYLSAESRSIHITDPVAIRALWESGFFGKGNLSRSEPSWMERERKRRGLAAGETSEDVTRRRREERREFKRDRAKKEREAIDQQLQAEGRAGFSDILEMSASTPDLESNQGTDEKTTVEPIPAGNARSEDPSFPVSEPLSATPENLDTTKPAGPAEANPESSLGRNKSRSDRLEHGVRFQDVATPRDTQSAAASETPLDSRPQQDPLNQEHLQLTLEEAFFLTYGLGVLDVQHEDDEAPLSNAALFLLCRQWSYFPPRDPTSLRMDDPFLLSYVVYHHFRSLGWVVRPGMKFAVDYLLYNRGPVFAHAEFAVMIVPSYSHPYYSQSADDRPDNSDRRQKPWWWLHCVNRVQSQVRKSLVLAFVEVPPPPLEESGSGANNNTEPPLCADIAAFLKGYKVREMNVKRWIPNRSRD